MQTQVMRSWRITVLWAGIPLVIGALNEYALLASLPSIRSEVASAVPRDALGQAFGLWALVGAFAVEPHTVTI
jgi:hypothetical protein